MMTPRLPLARLAAPSLILVLILVLATGAMPPAALAASGTVLQPPCDHGRIAAAGFVPRSLCQVLDAPLRDNANLHAVVVLRHGALVAERYYSGKDRSIQTEDTGPRHRHAAPAVHHDQRPGMGRAGPLRDAQR